MSFIRDFASKPRRQADMREFAQAQCVHMTAVTSSSSVKLYRSTSVLVDLPCYGHCSFSRGGVKMKKAQQHQSVIILQRHYYCGA